MQVLITDDSPFMRRVMKEILAQVGYDIIAEGQNGLEAIELYKKHLPDLVLLDHNMPEMTGMEAAREILKHDAKACIILVTSISGKQKILEALRIGVKNYITKPFDEKMFLATISRVMGKKVMELSNLGIKQTETPIIDTSFGRYLARSKKLSEKQLLQVLEKQAEINKKIGQIAIDKELISEEDVAKVLGTQKNINEYFGQIAIQSGLLQKSQLDSLLEEQKKNFISLEQVLVSEKVFSLSEIETFSASFENEKQQKFYPFSMELWSKQLNKGTAFRVFIESTLKLLIRLLGGLVTDGDYNIDHKEMTSHGIIVKVKVSGDNDWDYYLNLDQLLTSRIAEAMLYEEFGKSWTHKFYIGEDGSPKKKITTAYIETAQEFSNIATGKAISILEREEIHLEISPPVYVESTLGEVFTFPEDEQVLHVPVLSPKGKMEIAIAGKNALELLWQEIGDEGGEEENE